MSENVDISKSERWVNPRMVPKPEFIRIYSNDPRNNKIFLRKNPNTVVIPVKAKTSPSATDPTVDDGVDYGSSTSAPYTDPTTENAYPLPPLTISIPTNLSVSNFELKQNSGDGTVFYTANLSFDDVITATGYDYIINAVI